MLGAEVVFIVFVLFGYVLDNSVLFNPSTLEIYIKQNKKLIRWVI